MIAQDLLAVNLDLARQLERAEGMANAALVDARRGLEPDVGAAWAQLAGAYAMFDGADSPLTQTFGVGLFDAFEQPEFAAIEEFFAARNAPTFHEVSSMASARTVGLLGGRGYVPVEASVVLLRPCASQAGHSPVKVVVRSIDAHESTTWCKTSRLGWGSESPELADFIERFGAVLTRARGVTCFVAERHGVPVATAALNIANGVAILAGASTIPAARRQGIQGALLEARLAFAAEQGIQSAMVVTQPGSGSQRNALRAGFQPVYTRMKWCLPSK